MGIPDRAEGPPDAPGTVQALGSRAKPLASSPAFGKPVTAQATDADRYGRKDASVSDGPGRESGRVGLMHRSEVMTRGRFPPDSDWIPSAVGRSAHPDVVVNSTLSGAEQ
jgi:hypothetical protein